MNEQATNPAPWWKHGHVWLLISGPATVIVAGILTAWIAVATNDPVVDNDYYRKGIEINKQLANITALGRVGVPDDIGPMVASLLSADNRWVNAQRIEVSGGQAI